MRNEKRKMTLTGVQEMRELYGQGWTQSALCKRFGVTIGTVGRIVRGEAWMEEAGSRMPTQAESDRTIARLLALQAQVTEQGVEAVQNGAIVSRPIPPSPLDGGDTPSEAVGASEELQARARALGLDIDKELGL